jgi:hypothetical protein
MSPETGERYWPSPVCTRLQLVDNGVKLVALSGPEAKGTWEQLHIVMRRWDDLEGLAELPGPFVYTATRTKLTKISI